MDINVSGITCAMPTNEMQSDVYENDGFVTVEMMESFTKVLFFCMFVSKSIQNRVFDNLRETNTLSTYDYGPNQCHAI